MSKIVIYGRNVDAKVVDYGYYDTKSHKWSNAKAKKLVGSVRPNTKPEDLPDAMKGSRLWARKEETKSLVNVLKGI